MIMIMIIVLIVIITIIMIIMIMIVEGQAPGPDRLPAADSSMKHRKAPKEKCP